ncbi:DNA replication ATP-dependent helicase/nuclease dna2 [Sparassis crispa]|uniref:DNA replication ATP-dependent helicase/nuclease DNA2 n=1 Tax=Sparassis crispa TaxID=139825 RepID=A0A401GQW8_9APHY|nr:DNA replication ATP-dependent helicase/nuclease dna2 [Sparassis crispa]GBE84559.1 DNA replication ATP-dependent helicase/nuclease dna2 [Sparassis crispa]
MPPVTHTEREEADFLNDLLSGLDSSFFNAASSSDPPEIPSPHKKCPNVIPKTPTKVLTPRNVDLDELVAGAEDWDWDDMNSDFMSPKKPKSPKKTLKIASTSKYTPQTCTRCNVIRVDEVLTTHPYQKTLAVEVVPGRERRCVILRDDWADADVRVGDIVNVIGAFEPSPLSSSSGSMLSITVSAKVNLFILHPDLLITATSLSGAPQCRRKALVSNLTRRSLDVTPALVWGNMLHEVMQTCLAEGRWDERWVDAQITDVVGRGLGELIRIDMGVDQAKAEMKARAKGLKAFAEKYISQEPKPSAVLTNTRSSQSHTSLLAISQLHDVEEDIWSPTYGLKGKVDASVQAVISEIDGDSSPFTRAAPMCTTQNWTMPLEIKTGRAVAGMEHRAQTMLYTLLMAERYGTEVPSGLLYYTQSEEVVRVPAARNEVRALLVARNDMAGYMMRRIRGSSSRRNSADKKQGSTVEDLEELPQSESFLPPTIDDVWQCGKCYALDTCMLYRKAVENVVDETSPIADIYALKTSHLTPTQAAFFKKWEALISLEEQDIVRLKKELWTMGAEEREGHGRCFSNMVLDTASRVRFSKQQAASEKDMKIHRFTYKFRKRSASHTSLLNGHMSVGDAITVSVVPDLLALAKGFIVDLTPGEVVVGVDHELSIETIATSVRGRTNAPVLEINFRIDKDELFGGMGRVRDNLAQMFYADGDARRLQLVVDLKRPRFIDDTEIADLASQEILQLNENQRAAMKKVLSAQDYALILGMPGTGKTTVISALIRELVRRGKTVLLASYTHSAVDTILLKLKDRVDFGILRLGNTDKVHPDIQQFTLAGCRQPTTLEQLEHQLMAPPVVATTCLSIDHPVFSRRMFDYCIVDEASQITLPTCLGPLRFADKFVLVGDHFQLPPLVRNRDARKGGLDVSLFRQLSDAHHHAVVDLTEQYRMNADIMLLSNKLIYHDRLRCGSEAVAKRSLLLPDKTFLNSLHSGSKSACRDDRCWLNHLLDERCNAVFVDTDAVPARDSPVGDLVENQVEARLVYQVTESLLRSGIRQDQIGVLSLYRQQIKLLSYLLQDRKEIEILTADRSQGRDKDCIIISMVRSNDHGQIGNLLKDWRRMNVTFTRARSKLIIFGSRKTLQDAPLLAEFFQLMDSQGWILRLPENAQELHAIPCRSLSKKRSADDMDASADLFSPELKENAVRPMKKGRKSWEEGMLKGRPILRDLINESK